VTITRQVISYLQTGAYVNSDLFIMGTGEANIGDYGHNTSVLLEFQIRFQ